jgi:DNA replication protein DnaC
MDNNELARIIEECRARQPEHIAPAHARVGWDNHSPPTGTLEDRFARWRDELAAIAANPPAPRPQTPRPDPRQEALDAFLRSRGVRYANATLDSFEAVDARQRAVVQVLRKYAADLPAQVEAGRGVFLLGPIGTGKDHLQVAIAREAILQGITPKWCNVQRLFAEARDLMDSHDSEDDFVDRLMHPRILILSDVAPPFGNLTSWQAALLYRVVDGRYNHRLTTWTNANIANETEGAERIGAATIDRLADGALVCRCDWPSFRKPGRVVG